MLSERQAELEKLLEELKKPVDQIFTRRDLQKGNLVLVFKHITGILNLVEGKRSKKIKKLYQTDKKLQKISDKQLISISKSAVSIANRLGGFSVDGLEKITSKALRAKFEKARKLSEDLGLTADKVKKLEEATLNFARIMVEAREASKEKAKIEKQLLKRLDANDRLFKRRIDKYVEVYEKPGSNFTINYKKLRGAEKLKEQKEELAEV